MQDLLKRARRKMSRILHARPYAGDGPYDVNLYDRTLVEMRTWTPSDVVFDVGANDGRTALRLMRHLPVAPRIFSFEPVSSTYRVLVERTASHPNIRCFQLALGAQARQTPIYLNPVSALNSVVPESNPDWGRRESTEMIEMTTVDRMVDQLEVERIHLLKVDVEGHDLEVLRGGEAALSKDRVDFIQIECGMSPGRTPSLEDVRKYLDGFGYYLYSIDNQARGRPLLPNGEQVKPVIISYCDAMFVSGRHAMD